MSHSVNELARVRRLRSLFSSQPMSRAITLGIGDDAAVLSLASLGAAFEPSRMRGGQGAPEEHDASLVWTVDAQVEGTHFKTDWVSWADIGWRSFMAAASDLAAMGSSPVAALSSLVLAASVDDDALDALTRGQADAAAAVGAPIVGGNLSRGTETSITTTLLGRCAKPVLRTGARPGDGLWLAGSVGLARVGLLLTRQNRSDSRMQDVETEACLRAWRRPIARMEDGLTLAGLAHACIDISDGLSHDAWQLAEASDVQLVLDQAAVLEAGGEALVMGALVGGENPLELALVGGEDYALLAASSVPLSGFLLVGRVEAYESGPRLFMQTARGVVPLEPRGFDHFA